jgi:hypothetical protein
VRSAFESYATEAAAYQSAPHRLSKRIRIGVILVWLFYGRGTIPPVVHGTNNWAQTPLLHQVFITSDMAPITRQGAYDCRAARSGSNALGAYKRRVHARRLRFLKKKEAAMLLHSGHDP